MTASQINAIVASRLHANTIGPGEESGMTDDGYREMHKQIVAWGDMARERDRKVEVVT